MKKALMLLTIGCMLSGMVGCSSAPKKDEEVAMEESTADAEMDEAVASETETESTSAMTSPVEEPMPEPVQQAPVSSDLSLGAGSSGRGH